MNKSKVNEKEAGEKIVEDAKLVELKNKMDEDMRRLNFQMELDRSMALDELAGAAAVQETRDALISTIGKAKTGDIRVVFASLDWLFRYYAEMNRVFKTGIDKYLPDLK